MSSDEDFDGLVRQLWIEHLQTMDVATAGTKRWKSGYWRNWYRNLVLDSGEDDPIDGEHGGSEPDICEPLWSNAGSPPLADDDRRERPAAQHEHQQGGLSKSKPRVPAVRPSAVGETSASTYLPEVLARACLRYEAFYGLEPGDASAELIDETTSLTVAGWAEAVNVRMRHIQCLRRMVMRRTR